MQLVINGEKHEVGRAATVAELLVDLGIAHQTVAVMQNGDVLDRQAFNEVVLNDQDHLEIVRFVGGG